MPNDTQEITPKAALPAWATETPEPREPEECNPLYVLLVQEHEGEHLQTVEMTRAEFIGLKKHLAVMRGLPVPAEDEPDAAAAEPAEKKEQQTEPKSSLDQIKAGLADDIAEIVRENARGIPGEGAASILGDLQILKDIMERWQQCGMSEEFPNETPLIGSIREELHL